MKNNEIDKLTDICSWEKGVNDAWDCVVDILMKMGNEDDIKDSDRMIFRAIAHTLEDIDHVDFTRSFVEIRNLDADDEEEDELEVGDLVIDPSGNECIITNIGTHIHVIYTDNLKTHKWKLDTEFKPTGLRVIGMGKVNPR